MDRLLKLLERWHGIALGFYPAEFRHEYGSEMTQFFRDECRRTARRSGIAGLLLTGLRNLADVARIAPGVHMDILLQDVRFGFRMLRNNPGFAMTAILALALGIGANSAIFSLVHGVVLAPLPFPEPERLVMIWDKSPRGIDRNSMSPPNFADYRAGAKSFAAMGAFVETGREFDGLGRAGAPADRDSHAGVLRRARGSPDVGSEPTARGRGGAESRTLAAPVWQGPVDRREGAAHRR